MSFEIESHHLGTAGGANPRPKLLSQLHGANKVKVSYNRQLA